MPDDDDYKTPLNMDQLEQEDSEDRNTDGTLSQLDDEYEPPVPSITPPPLPPPSSIPIYKLESPGSRGNHLYRQTIIDDDGSEQTASNSDKSVLV